MQHLRFYISNELSNQSDAANPQNKKIHTHTHTHTLMPVSYFQRFRFNWHEVGSQYLDF